MPSTLTHKRHSVSAIDVDLLEIVERISQQLRAGEVTDLEQAIVEHPQYADRLRQLLPVMQAVAEFGAAPASPADSTEPLPALSESRKRVGEFRLIRELGRGGMGIVYEAEQETLGRRVALKVLPFAAVLDPRQLQRFKNEAKAAATLHHTNIVPVHSVGNDRGIHYFAMQYIEGSSLEAILRELRESRSPTSTSHDRSSDESTADQGLSPATDTRSAHALTSTFARNRQRFYRQLVHWAIEAAEAWEHAHFHGIVHRDIKPSNLLIDIDNRLWITDFGLARVETETGINMTGDVLGTLRYMSPEQAAGRQHVIDPRCDIYSLGTTLYEMLTLTPAFPALERPELLRQISEQEPRKLRAIDREIPSDLETIVLKAMQKSPEDRYGSAQELADDLRRFLECKSIVAKRPRRVTQAVRWIRRHIEALSAMTITSLLALSLAAGLLTRAYRQEYQQRTIAEQQRERAEQHLEVAYSAVDSLYTRFAEEDRLKRSRARG